MRSNVSVLVFILALFVSDIFTTSVLKKSNNVRMIQMLEKMESKTGFSKTLLTTVQLKLKTGSIDDVYTLLDELVTGIQQQQNDADDEHKTKNIDWNNQISNLTDTLSSLNEDLTTQQGDLADYQQQQLAHQATHDQLVQTDSDLNDQLDALNAAWAQDNEDYTNRQNERTKVIDALETIIGLLTDKLNAGSFIQLKDLVATMKAVKGQRNPILALVQLTMSFNPATVQNVIDKLTSVKQSISTGATDDAAYHDYMDGLYTVHQSDLQNQISTTEDSIATETATLADLASSISKAQAQIASDQTAISNDTDLLNSVTDAQNTYNAKYESDTDIRNSEVAVIQHVQATLKSNDSNLRVNDGN